MKTLEYIKDLAKSKDKVLNKRAGFEDNALIFALDRFLENKRIVIWIVRRINKKIWTFKN